jgi:hypothetical protein
MGALASACAPEEAGVTAQGPAREGQPSPVASPAVEQDLPPTRGQNEIMVPTAVDKRRPIGEHVGDLPQGEGTIQIPTVGKLTFDAGEVRTVRPDLFQEGHFSLFDILVHLGQRGDIDLAYHFDESLDTHVVDALDGDGNWWYEAHYSNGWYEANVWRMDMYPYKNDSSIRLRVEKEDRLAKVHRSFQEEVERLARNGGQVVIPDLEVRSPYGNWSFKDVVATPHDVRSDVLQPGRVTALDALISLHERGQVDALELTWYEQIGHADPVDSYWVSRFNSAEAYGGCGFVYETGPMEFSGFSGTHIHIPADVRALVSPEYALWFWLCL